MTYKTPYHKDAIEFTIPKILKEIEELFNEYEERDEKLEAMVLLRKGMKKIYAGWMDLGKN